MVLQVATTPAGGSSVGERGRVRGVDAARAVALLGMMSVHVLPAVEGGGGTSPAFLVASGRASALFAVLAGVGLALMTGGPRPYRDRRLPAAWSGLLARAGILALVGLALGARDTPVAVILVYYAVLFPCALPFLPLGAGTLAALAGGSALLTPVLSHAVRSSLPAPSGANPTFGSLDEPGPLLTELVVTGYYPVLPWTAYLLAGLAAGRLALNSPRVAAGLLAGGAALAVLAKAASWLLLNPLGGMEQIRTAVPAGSSIEYQGLDVALTTSLYGTTPTTSWWWLAVSGPHSGTPFDLLHTIGTSLGVLGACLLVVRVAAPLLAPLTAAGSMTLTLYSGHVLVLGAMLGDIDAPRLLLLHAAVALALAMLWRSGGHRRGPLEAVAAVADRSARSLTRKVMEPRGSRPPDEARI